MVEDKNWKRLFKYMGIKINEEESTDTELFISHYSPEVHGFTLNELGVNENELLKHVVYIEGDANFANSNATSLPINFIGSQISDIRNLVYINDYEISRE